MHQNQIVDVVDGVVVDVTDQLPLAGGVLEIVEGIGFLRGETLLPSPDDIYVSQTQIHKFGLRTGQMVEGLTRPPDLLKSEMHHSLMRIEAVDGVPPETIVGLPHFHEMTPIEPHTLYNLNDLRCGLAPRLTTLIAPIGHGQRGLLIGSPGDGKTTIIIEIANAFEICYPDVVVMAVLIGERPEEVTRIERATTAEVYSADFDAETADQIKVARLAFERAKRLAEMNKNVVVLWDGITRTTRAYNIGVPSSGKTMSGGIEAGALHGKESTKGMLGTARALENGGSVATLATLLINTGNRMDDVIYEEFKGTGNMRLELDHGWAEKKVFPALNFDSGTRRDELLLDQETRVWREIILNLFRLTGWGSDWTKREVLFDTVRQEPTWPKVGLTLLQRVFKKHPGAKDTFFSRLSPSAISTLYAEVEQQMTEEELWTFEALAKVPKMLEKEDQKKAET